MPKMKSIIENQFIENLTRFLPRCKAQMNGLQETDAEIIRIGPQGPLLALTMDSIAEEIETGLYSDPFLLGWMAVLVNASDLSAVGARPLGILINETFGPQADAAFVNRLQQGIAQASQACELPVLGGDTNFSGHTELSACAVGLCDEGSFLKRRGCRPGDLLYTTGRMGLGNAFALRQLKHLPLEIEYRPQPRFMQSGVIREFATCCMDSSDGLLTTLDQLMRINDLGFDVQRDPDSYLHPRARDLCRSMGLPQTALLAAPHGEFELVFTIPPEREMLFLGKSREADWQPLLLGTVTKNPGLRLITETGVITPDTAEIRNLFDQQHGNMDGYIRQLIQYLKSL